VPVVFREAQHHLDEVHVVRHRHTVGAGHRHALVHDPTDCFTGLWSCNETAVRDLHHGGDGIEGRIDDQLRPEIGVDMLRDATWNTRRLEPFRHASDRCVTCGA